MGVDKYMAINLYQSQVTQLLKFIHIDCSIIFFWNRQFLKRIVACRIAGNFLFFEKSSAFLNVLLCHKIVWHLIFALKSISFSSFAYLGTLLETRLFVKILLQAYLKSSLVYPVYYLHLYFRIDHIFPLLSQDFPHVVPSIAICFAWNLFNVVWS